MMNGNLEMRPIDWRWLSALPGLTVVPSYAAPIEGDDASHAAMLLMFLGLWAIAVGIRNQREMRYRRYRREARSDGLAKRPTEDYESQLPY